MAERVVDLLEVVKIHHDHDLVGAQPPRCPADHAPVRKPGEAVDRCVLIEPAYL